MVKQKSTLVFIFLFLLFSSHIRAQSNAEDKAIQTVIHLLSYISLDYSEAVSDGKIIDQFEYEEQLEFSNQVFALIQDHSFLGMEDQQKMLSQTNELIESIEKKLPVFVISKIADNIKNNIIIITGVQTAPATWPSLKKGQQSYKFLCIDCHGAKGDGQGRLAASLEPVPSSFLNHDFMSKFSAYQTYNSIKLGLPGTSMRAYAELSDEEIWDLAFYVKSIRFQDKVKDSLQMSASFDEAYKAVALKEVANLTDLELLDTLKATTSNPEMALVALRTQIPDEKDLLSNSLEIAKKELFATLKSYSEGHQTLARTHALNAYLEGIEPVEKRLRSIDGGFVLDIERQMLKVRQAVEKDLGIDVLKQEVEKALELIDDADKKLSGQVFNFWLTFLLAGSIMLREGLEAFLILSVVLALIRSTGVRKALPWLHAGWVSAVILGFAGWFLSGYIFQISTQNREVMEGLISLFAVAVLMWAGFWLHSKTQAQQWAKFIKVKIGGYLQKDRMFGLAIFSFMVVFREAFEVILFLKTISLEANDQSAIGLGVLAATVFIGIFAFFFLKYSKMIPIRQLFRFSSWIIILFAFILLGKGIRSLQESGWVPSTILPKFIHSDLLGIYPTAESLLAQLGLITLVVLSYFMSKRRNKEATIEQ